MNFNIFSLGVVLKKFFTRALEKVYTLENITQALTSDIDGQKNKNSPKTAV